MKVELPGESKSFADIEAGECFAFTRKHVSSVCMKVEWLSSASVAVLWSASDDWTVPHLIAPTDAVRPNFGSPASRLSGIFHGGGLAAPS
jgi:hypothetical protein